MDNEELICPKCSSELEIEDCTYCGGDGGKDWEELQFEDPLWYTPDDFIKCDECYGTGCFYRCYSCNRLYTIRELQIKQEKS